MKIEVLRSDDGVEIHRENEDGSKTVWLCDNDEVAIFKVNTLLFSTKDDPKLAKRSILIGDFDRAEEENAVEKKPLASRAAEVAKRLESGGLIKKGQKAEKSLEVNEELLELLKKMKDTPPKPLTDDFFSPGIHVYPATIQPFVMPSYPQVGGMPFNQPYGTIDVNVCGDLIGATSSKPMMSSMVVTDTSLGSTYSNGQKTHLFKTSFNGNG